MVVGADVVEEVADTENTVMVVDTDVVEGVVDTDAVEKVIGADAVEKVDGAEDTVVEIVLETVMDIVDQEVCAYRISH